MQRLLQSCGSKLQFPDYRSGLQDILVSDGWSGQVDISDDLLSSVSQSPAKSGSNSESLESLREKLEILEKRVVELEVQISLNRSI